MINLKTEHMNKLIVLVTFVFAACTGTTQQDAKEAQAEHQTENAAAPQLDNGAKWKTDAATKKNVAALKQVMNDSAFIAAPGKLAAALQNRLDTLINQCTMQGQAHEALHQWLEPIIHSVKELKEDGEKESERQEALTAIRKALEDFDKYFE
jgi:hypothetical protein